MAQITITFEDPSAPPNPGTSRIYSDDAYVCCTDQGSHPASDVQIGWKVRQTSTDPWLTVISVVTE